tara:strand:+ start:2203 stop:2640 length:438 start_codon:yes stop_codon:yes gene_type:complete
MSEELKRYRLNGLRFVHDSRGKYVQDGGVAWLDDDKAGCILRALSRSGRPDDLVLIDEVPASQGEPEPIDPSTSDSTAGEDGFEGALLSVDILETVLALHFSKRKTIASLLVNDAVQSTPEADEIISSSSAEDLQAAFEAIKDEA